MQCVRIVGGGFESFTSICNATMPIKSPMHLVHEQGFAKMSGRSSLAYPRLVICYRHQRMKYILAPNKVIAFCMQQYNGLFFYNPWQRTLRYIIRSLQSRLPSNFTLFDVQKRSDSISGNAEKRWGVAWWKAVTGKTILQASSGLHLQIGNFSTRVLKHERRLAKQSGFQFPS